MKNQALALAAVSVFLVSNGCASTTYSPPNRTVTGVVAGGAIGAGSGALLGSMSGHAGQGAIIGAGAGMLTGGLIGSSMDQMEQTRVVTPVVYQQTTQSYTPAPQQIQQTEQARPMSVADVKSLAKAGISEEIIMSQIRASGSSFRLSAADIIDLRDAGVSNRTIDWMINAQGSVTSQQVQQVAQVGPSSPQVVQPPQEQQVIYVNQQPPPPLVETLVVAPGPGFVWIGGDWWWNGRWSWRSGYWCRRPYAGAVWIGGGWGRGGPDHGGRGWEHHSGHWR